MNKACFTAYSFDLEGSENAVHDYKGCSAFSEPNESCASLPVPDSDDVTTCKSTCDTSGCNNVTPQKTNACYTCDVTLDSNNNTIGVGNDACFHDPQEGDLQFCSQPDAKCVTEMLVDWKLRGMQQFRVMRGCQNKEMVGESDCSQGQSADGLSMFKDCLVECEGFGCNKGLDDVAELFASETKQEQCFSCLYIEYDDGTTEGNKYCGDEPDLIDTIATATCPTYANAGCYTGSNAHYSTINDDILVEEVFKGCSTFDPSFEDGSLCNIYENMGVGGEAVDVGVCKEFCVGDNCNKEHVNPNVPPKDGQGFSCYTCSITKDHMGNTVGYGDETCWTSNPGRHLLQECPDENDVCLTDMMVDWTQTGAQLATIMKRCGKPHGPTHKPCVEQALAGGRVYYRDCMDQCETSGCNTDIEYVLSLHDQASFRNSRI